jgi:hypothetical protein
VATQQPKGFLGYCSLLKTAGQTGAGPALWSSGAPTYSFPIGLIMPRNPDNFSYPAVVNAQGAPSVKVQGKYTPTVTLQGIPLKSSFCVPLLFNDLIGGSTSHLDTNNNSSEYTLVVHNGSSIREYQGSRCQMMSLYQTSEGGPILMDLQWLCKKGDQSTSGATAPATDAGTLLDITKVTFASENLTAVYNWRLTLMRPQGYNMQADGTLFSDDIQSGMIGGTFAYTTSPLSATILAAATAMTIASSTPVTMTIQVNRDEPAEDVAPALGRKSFSYTLIKSTAGYPIAIA